MWFDTVSVRTSKMSCVGVLLLSNKSILPSYIGDGLFAILVLGFISIKLVFFLRGVDVLSYPEKHVCYVLFGGLVDDLQDWYETYGAQTSETEDQFATPTGRQQRRGNQSS